MSSRAKPLLWAAAVASTYVLAVVGLVALLLALPFDRTDVTVITFAIVHIVFGWVIGRWGAVLLPFLFLGSGAPFWHQRWEEDVTIGDLLATAVVSAALFLGVGVGLRKLLAPPGSVSRAPGPDQTPS